MESKYYYKSPIGILEIQTAGNALTSVRLVAKAGKNSAITEFLRKVITQFDEYFSGKRKKFDLEVFLSGTVFQRSVWNELIKIPYGQTKSYGDIASGVGNKNASRAVGGACNKNHILIVIPCHRVVSKNGNIGGFEYGVDVKEKLLKLESGLL